MKTKKEDELTFEEKLAALIKEHGRENNSDTPDYILAEYLQDCLKAFDRACNARTRWYK